MVVGVAASSVAATILTSEIVAGVAARISTTAITAGGLTAASGGAVTVTFKHGARHLGGSTLSPATVESAIAAHAAATVNALVASEKVTIIPILIEGQIILYRAYVVRPGFINVGTYVFPR